jgi:hypothetical protein
MNKALAISLYLESFPNAVGVVVSALAKAQPFWFNAVIPLIAVLTSECRLHRQRWYILKPASRSARVRER